MGNPQAGVQHAVATEEVALRALFTRYREELEKALRDGVLPDRARLSPLLQYHMGWLDDKGRPLADASSQGKALRPILCLLVCQALGGDWRKALPAAVALELAHNFSLIHDDIQDGDTERRHRPTVWYLWGKRKAVIAGNALRSYADATLGHLSNDFPAETRLRASRVLSERCLEMIEGQYLDLFYENRLDIGVRDYLEMVSRKTGALMQCATELGALLASRSLETVQNMAHFGRCLGLAFQIRDDILGIWGDPAMTGKTVGNDIRRRKKSLPVVYALEHASGPARQVILRIYGGAVVDNGDVTRILSILREVGAAEQSQALAQAKAAEALAALRRVDMSPNGRAELEAVVHFLVSRDY